MKKILTRFQALFITALLLQLVIVLPQNTQAAVDLETSAPSWTTEIDYLALGDSLAAGMDFNGGMGAGYADYLAEEIQETGYLQSYNKAFAYPGYTTVNVLDDLEANVSRPVEGEALKLQDAIQQAELITLSAGANDVLPLIEIDPTTGNVTYDEAKISAAIQQLGVNTAKILAAIHELNPNAQVYVMGYYNPYPLMPEEIQPLLNTLLGGINLSLGMVTNNENVHFVATDKAIAGNPLVYLPNPSNIHLSEAGYRKVTEQFWNRMQDTFAWIPTDSVTADAVGTNDVTLNWKPATSNSNVVNYEVFSGENKIATVAGDVTTYKVENLDEDTTYIFSIGAVDETGAKSIHNPTIEVSTGEKAALFTDIRGHWAEEFIEQAAILNLLNGHNDGSFKPDNSLTRVQAASIIVRALGLKTDETAPFKDMSSYAASTQAEINAAYKYNLVKGSNGNFMPSKKVTRAQLALMIERAYTFKTGEQYIAAEKAPYTDFGKYDEETVNAISMLYELNIATGSNGKFNPSNPTTRAHAAKMFVNFADLLK